MNYWFDQYVPQDDKSYAQKQVLEMSKKNMEFEGLGKKAAVFRDYNHADSKRRFVRTSSQMFVVRDNEKIIADHMKDVKPEWIGQKI